MPYYPTDEKNSQPYEINTLNFRIVAEYTALNFNEIKKLDIDDFLIYQRDAFIHRMSETEQGREYLENCYRIEQDKPDYDEIRNYKKGG